MESELKVSDTMQIYENTHITKWGRSREIVSIVIGCLLILWLHWGVQ